MSGIAQFIANRGVGALKDWMDEGYDHSKIGQRVFRLDGDSSFN